MDNAAIERRKHLFVEVFHQAPMAVTTGMSLRYDGDDAVLDMPFQKGLTHAMGDTHGGFVAGLIDNAGWFTAALHYDRWINTVEFSVKLLEPANHEALVGRGKLVRAGKQLASCAMEVRSASGRVIAVGSGTFAVSTIEIPKP